jgi:hypothetical protein
LLARLESARNKPRMDQKPAYYYEAEVVCQERQWPPEHRSGRDKPRMNRELAYYEAEEACQRPPAALTPPVLLASLAPVRDSPVDKKPAEHTRAARRGVPGLESYIREMIAVDLWINAGQ